MPKHIDEQASILFGKSDIYITLSNMHIGSLRIELNGTLLPSPVVKHETDDGSVLQLLCSLNDSLDTRYSSLPPTAR